MRRLALVMLLIALRPAAAADLDPAIVACRAIIDATRRLICYDQIGAQQPAAPVTDVKHYTGIPKPGVLHQKVLTASKAPDGRLTITLDNGQTWTQVDTQSGDIRVGDDVTINPGALGSYLLVGPRDRRSLRMRWQK